MKNDEGHPSTFKYCLLSSVSVFILFFLMAILLDFEAKASSSQIALVSGFAATLTVIWVAGGIILTQHNLKIYSKELSEQREELKIQSSALKSLSEANQMQLMTAIIMQGQNAMIRISNDIKEGCDGVFFENDNLETILIDSQKNQCFYDYIKNPSAFAVHNRIERFINIQKYIEKKIEEQEDSEQFKRIFVDGHSLTKISIMLEKLFESINQESS